VTEAAQTGTPPGDRIAKVLARAGVCSRRDAERLIAEGRVKVDGKVLTSPALNVTRENRIEVDNEPLRQAEPTRLWLYHKPVGLVTSHKDPQGRPTVFDNMPPALPRVISVGRLDFNSEGLLLLTNDGELSRKLELPATGWTRRYRARIFGQPTADVVQQLARGITVEGIAYGPIEAVVESTKGDNSWLMVSLREGKNREVRRAMEHFGFSVSRLIRIAYGPFQLGTLPEGAVKEVPPKVLREQLGRQKEDNKKDGGNAGHADRRRQA